METVREKGDISRQLFQIEGSGLKEVLESCKFTPSRVGLLFSPDLSISEGVGRIVQAHRRTIKTSFRQLELQNPLFYQKDIVVIVDALLALENILMNKDIISRREYPHNFQVILDVGVIDIPSPAVVEGALQGIIYAIISRNAQIRYLEELGREGYPDVLREHYSRNTRLTRDELDNLNKQLLETMETLKSGYLENGKRQRLRSKLASISRRKITYTKNLVRYQKLFDSITEGSYDEHLGFLKDQLQSSLEEYQKSVT